MKKQLLFLLAGSFINLNSFVFKSSEDTGSNLINDGPYIFKADDKFKVLWIENNIFREDDIIPENFNSIRRSFNLFFDYNDLIDTYLLKPDYGQSYNRIDSISVISDIHGEYNTYIELLKVNGIIDKDLNWNFGKGHLVVLGDIFDRGDMVTEVLWHLFGLEKQAAKAGGMVHVLLGNHEFMVLRNNLCDIHEKYRKVEAISGTLYSDLYSESSLLGKWLRSKPVVITINNIIFVHGGISLEMVHRNLTFKQINRICATKILGKDLQSVYSKELLKFLNHTDGPLWYRGYFEDTDFCESKLDSILEFYGKKHIVVGHTVCKVTTPLFNNKIIGVDTGIMYKQPGEIVIYKNGFFYKGCPAGSRTRL
jgi:hypothetical protein